MPQTTGTKTATVPAKLSTPTAVTTKLSQDQKTITVNWTALNDPNVLNYTVSFVPKDGSQPAPPASQNTKDGAANSVDFTPGDGIVPSASDLKSNYFAVVYANPQDAQKFAQSDPGIQPGLTPYMSVDLALVITIGSQQITLTKPADSNANGGVYRLPPTQSLNLNLSDLKKVVPSSVPLPDFGSTSLKVSDVGIDLDNKLFKMAVDLQLDSSLQNLIPGIQFNGLHLEVERTDGVHHTLDDAAPAT